VGSLPEKVRTSEESKKSTNLRGKLVDIKSLGTPPPTFFKKKLQ
jgi:hypothetical protein